MLLVFLWVAWVIFNGKFTVEIAIFGAGFAVLLYVFSVKALGYNTKMEKKFFRNFGKILVYLGVLVWEIIKANIAIMKFVFKPGDDIEPKLVYFKSGLKGDVAKTALANSITITPGTITVWTNHEDDVFCVHAFDKSMAEGLDESVFVKRLKKMED